MDRIAKQALTAARAWLRSGLACERGVAALDFAFIGPPFILFLIGTLEMAVLFATSTSLEGAVTEAARTGITGAKGSAKTREDYIRAAVDRVGGALVDPAKITLDTLVYPSFDSIGKPEPFIDKNKDGVHQDDESFTDVNGNGVWDADMGKAGLGGANDIVLYRVRYAWRPITPLLPNLLPNKGEVNLTSSMAIRNEPYE